MIHVFVGTKAQLIKMAPVMKELAARGEAYNFVFSGQHRDTIDELLESFGLPEPDCQLYTGPDITRVWQMVVWALRLLLTARRDRERIWQGDRHGVVLVHGDTASTLLGALLARLSGLRCAHVESGLSSGKLFKPFPEEMIRRMLFRLSHYLFAPGALAASRLEGRRGEVIDTEHNTLVDTLDLALSATELLDPDLPADPFAVVSLHRFENIFSRRRLAALCDILNEVAREMPLLFILHKPTRAQLQRYGLYAGLDANPRIHLHPRFDYVRFVRVLQRSAFIITDGGSNQEECSYLGKPCLIMREETERPEGLGENAMLCGSDSELAIDFARNWQRHQHEPKRFAARPSAMIVDRLAELGYASAPARTGGATR